MTDHEHSHRRGLELNTIPELIRAARQRLPQVRWDQASGGVESETTLRRNRLAMEHFAFRPRLLQGAAQPSLATSVLGRPLATPVMLAPVGTIATFHDEGALGPARVAARRGSAYFYGILGWPGIEEVARAGAAPLVLQIYVRGDREWLKDVIGKAETAGFAGLCITADSSGSARRDRDQHNRFQHNHAARSQPNLREGGGPGYEFQRAFRWEDFAWLRSATRLPLVLKGVTSADDARQALAYGADAIYVSNHGGRELDHLPATMEVLPEIVAAVDGRAEVYVDSGFLRGTDVVKALALGARAVLLGKLQVWALAAAGEPGLERALEILDEEIAETLTLLGVPTIHALSPEFLRPSAPTRTYQADLNQYEFAPLPRL